MISIVLLFSNIFLTFIAASIENPSAQDLFLDYLVNPARKITSNPPEIRRSHNKQMDRKLNGMKEESGLINPSAQDLFVEYLTNPARKVTATPSSIKKLYRKKKVEEKEAQQMTRQGASLTIKKLPKRRLVYENIE